ncbi:MAG: hypothetical protein P8L18_16470 [Verrucomicrobiota bacterium]|nr:hypothetical protein [Verrucomicrobiota bacterium]
MLSQMGSVLHAQKLAGFWGTSEREEAFYRLVDIPLPDGMVLEAGSFDLLPDDRLAVGTRRGDIYLVKGAFDDPPQPEYHLYASGLDEVTGLSWRDGSFFVTQQTEVTRITDTDGDERADSFLTLSDVWGFANYHEFSFGSKADPDGNIWVTLCLSKSYESLEPFRGWALKVSPDGRTIPVASGIRSPCGVGPNAQGAMFYAESQGPWNGSCSLKHLKQGGFMGHPVSFNWYELAPEMGPAPTVPNTRSRMEIERQRVKELVPYAVVFPYRRMGQQLSGFSVDSTQGAFGPFKDQIFIGDYTLSVLMRATTEKVNGVWQGACYPFREGFATGLLANQFTSGGRLIVGGTNRGWPVRGPSAFALQRVEWTGRIPFEIKEINARPGGFQLTFTQPLNPAMALKPDTFKLETFTHIYHQGYGSPEVDQTKPLVEKVKLSDDHSQARIWVNGLVQGHVHSFDLSALRSGWDESLLHPNAYYTLNEIPEKQ